MMIALVDIGNTRTKYVVIINGIWQESCVINNNEITEFWLDNQFTYVTKLVVASVASADLIARMHQWCDSNKIFYQQIFSEKIKFGLTSAYKKPTQLGVDRWLAMLGAIASYPQKNLVVIDAGTATTFDIVDHNGQHYGGWILAGIDALFTSVTGNTQQVEATSCHKGSLTFGLDSSENVNNACWAATIGTILLAINQAKELLTNVDHVLVTGGNALEISKLMKEKIIIDEKLILKGLQQYL